MRGPIRSIAIATAITLTTMACASQPSTPEASGVATTAMSVDPAAVPPFPLGSAQVTVGGTVYSFALNRCEVAVDTLVVDGTDGTRSLTIRHASPPTRQPPEPAMSVFAIENGERLEAPPASLVFAVCDPTTGSAEGEAPVASGGDAEPQMATFSVQCERL